MITMRILIEERAAGPNDACYQVVNEIGAEPVSLQTARPHLEDMCWRTCWNVERRSQTGRNPPGFICKQSCGCVGVQMS